jgi:glucan biosynthesis protein C
VPPPSRHYGMDWLRIGAFALLILYHVGLVFGPWAYELKTAHPADWVSIPMLFTNSWRLSLLFAISGYASAALLAREGALTARMVGRFTRGRLARLGIPLLFGMAVIVTPQPWVALVTQHGYAHGFGWFLQHDYYRFQAIDGIKMPTWMHLWFVVYLLTYTLVFAAMLLLPARVQAGAKAAAERVLAGALLLPIPALLIWAARSQPGAWSDTHGLFDDGYAHLTYFPMFLFGVLLRASEPLRAAIARQWPLALALGLTGYAVIVGFELLYPGLTPLPNWARQPYNLARSVQAWGSMVALFGIAERYWNRDGAWRATLAEAVFPFYIIHQTVILVVGYWLLGRGIGAPAEFAILVAATATGCWLFYLAGREIGPLRPLIGLKRRAPSPSPPSPAAAPSP